MSTYSQYGIGAFDEAVEADLTYSGLAGAYRMVEENAINEHNIFEAVIGRDFMEAYTKQGVVSESALEAINEASMSEIWGKVVEFIKKIGEKILGIITNLKNKIQAVFIKDGKELVNKYGKIVNERVNKGQLSKMKFKYCKPQTAPFTSAFEVLNSSTLGKTIDDKFARASKFAITAPTSLGGSVSDEEMKTLRDMEDFKPLESDKKDEFRDGFYSEIISGSDSKSFPADLDNAMFDSPEEIEGFDSAMKNTCEEVLKTCKDGIKFLEKDEKECKKWIKDYQDKAKKIEKEMNNIMSKTNNAALAYKANGLASQVTALCTIASECTTKSIGELTKALKKHMKQCRSIYIKAATYGVKTEAYDIEFMTAIEEASNYEVDLMFED